jgi:hypothetical protein
MNLRYTLTEKVRLMATLAMTFVAVRTIRPVSPAPARHTWTTGFKRSRMSVAALASIVLICLTGCTGSPSTLALQPDFAIATPIGIASVSMREALPSVTDDEFRQLIRAGMERAAPGDVLPGPVQRPFPEYRIVWHVFPYGNSGTSRLVVNIFKMSVPFAYEQAVVGNGAPRASIVGTVESMSGWLIADLAHAHI